jgi:hypothetical protein
MCALPEHWRIQAKKEGAPMSRILIGAPINRFSFRIP